MANFMPLLTELGVIDRAQVYKQVAPNGAFNPRCADRLFNKAKRLPAPKAFGAGKTRLLASQAVYDA
jgi:hypothetical protein